MSSLGLGLGNNLTAISEFQAAIPTDSYSIELDGSTDYMQLGTNFASVFAADADFSFSGWVFTEYSVSRLLFSSGDDDNDVFLMVAGGSGIVQFGYGASSQQINSTELSTNNWHHVAVVHDESAELISYYVDGSLEGTDDFNLSGTVSGANARVGTSSHSEGLNEFKGHIGSFAIYDAALSAANVTSLGSSSGFDAASVSSCVGWWRMGDGTGDATSGTGGTIADQTTNSNDGTLVNGAEVISGSVEY